jgi:hypothetical protein
MRLLPHEVGEDGWGPVRQLVLNGNAAMAQLALGHHANGATPTSILPHFVGEEGVRCGGGERAPQAFTCSFMCLSARFFISSGLRSSLCVAMCQTWPNGSVTLPSRSP